MVSSSSSPSPSKKPKYSSSSAYVTRFDNRQTTIFNKARELSTLIDVKVCVICYGLSGDLKTWPEDIKEVKKIAESYMELSEANRLRGKYINKDKDKTKKVRDLPKVTYPVWESRFDNYSADQLRVLIQSGERNHIRVQNRKDVVRKGKGQRNNMGNQEPTMNHHYHHHLQHQSNQVSLSMYNHGNSDTTQIPPVSQSDFSQGQSLPPLPFELMNDPYSYVGNSSITQIPPVSASALNQDQSLAPLPPELMNYSGSLGVQGTGSDVFQNMNMGSLGVQGCQNMNMGSLGVQETGINGFQNISYDYFHVNDSSYIF